MFLPIRICVFSLILQSASAQMTKVKRVNPLLTRQKRYLLFPMSSNMVITLSLTKPLLELQPNGYVEVLECDIPFGLPGDTRIFRKFPRRREKRELLSQIEQLFERIGFNGRICVERLVCETAGFIENNRNSLFGEMFSVVLVYLDEVRGFGCQSQIFDECPFSLLEIILQSLPT